MGEGHGNREASVSEDTLYKPSVFLRRFEDPISVLPRQPFVLINEMRQDETR